MIGGKAETKRKRFARSGFFFRAARLHTRAFAFALEIKCKHFASRKITRNEPTLDFSNATIFRKTKRPAW